MNDLTTLNWRLILFLGALALVRPLIRIVGDQSGAAGTAATPIAITIAISVIWIAVAGFTTVNQPLLTLVCAALTYGVLSIVLSAIVSVTLEGQLDGPLAHPVRIIPALAVNAVWGLLTGAVALGIRRARGTA